MGNGEDVDPDILPFKQLLSQSVSFPSNSFPIYKPTKKSGKDHTTRTAQQQLLFVPAACRHAPRCCVTTTAASQPVQLPWVLHTSHAMNRTEVSPKLLIPAGLREQTIDYPWEQLMLK